MLTRAIEPISPLEVLRLENAVLKETIAEASIAVDALETALEQAGVSVPPHGQESASLAGFEDYWSPAMEVVPSGAFVEEYGSLRYIQFIKTSK